MYSNCRNSKEFSHESISVSSGERMKKVEYVVPKYLSKVVITNNEGGIEVRYKYRDSAIFYITNVKSGSEINRKTITQNIEYYNCKFTSDTCSVYGKMNGSWFWAERKVGVVFFGYSKVDSANVIMFNRAINSLKE